MKNEYSITLNTPLVREGVTINVHYSNISPEKFSKEVEALLLQINQPPKQNKTEDNG